MELTRDQGRLLVYLEVRAVNLGGVDFKNVSREEIAMCKEWDKSGYITFCRFRLNEYELRQDTGAYYIRLSDEAYKDAAKLRKERAERNAERHYKRTTRGE